MENHLNLLEERVRGTVKDLLIKRIKQEKRIFIGDTTLRDGEQAPGASLNVNEKLEIAQQLNLLGVDSIEAGFPISSKSEFESVGLISRKVRRPVITALCRCKEEDIDCAKEALRHARRWGLALFSATSPILRRYSLAKSREETVKIITDAVRYARRFTDNVAFGAEDASRTEPEFLHKIYREVIDAGALVVGFPDTVGCLVPEEVKDIIGKIKSNVPNLNKAFLAVHFHNDLGLAAANTLAAIESGVNIVQCTVNGIGERAGNTSLEEVVMVLNTKKERYKAKHGIKTKELFKTSRLVSRLTGLGVAVNKPIVGENVFASEAGIHQAALLKNRTTYEIIKPQDVGQVGTKIVLGRHSGKHALLDRMECLGVRLPKNKRQERLDNIYSRFKEIAATKKIVTDSDLRTMINEITKEE